MTNCQSEELVHNAGNAKIWVWTALDYADEEQKASGESNNVSRLILLDPTMY